MATTIPATMAAVWLTGHGGIDRLEYREDVPVPRPEDTVVLPGHDYRGNTSSTIGAEKAGNPRIAGRSRQEYIDLMHSIEFPLPGRFRRSFSPISPRLTTTRSTSPTSPT